MITTDKDIQETVKFIKELKLTLGVWDGNQLGQDISSLIDAVHILKDEYDREQGYRLNNPAVGEAYQHYQTMLALAKEDNNEKNV